MKIYDRLLNRFGNQHWWPTISTQNPKFEIIVGAILTQQTSWKNVEKSIKNLKDNISLIQNEGFDLPFHFTLPKSSWIVNYYSPMKKMIKELKKKYHENKTALQVFAECEKEIKIFNKYSDYFGYEFFITQKNQDSNS